MSRILWLSNAPWCGSGYGEQTATFTPRLQALGHEMAILGNFGAYEATIPWNGIPVYPSDNSWGNKSIRTWHEKHKADLCITLADAFIMEPHNWPEIQMAIWAPIDHGPMIPAAVLAVLSNENVTPIAMSRFGERTMKAGGLEPLYVPHGIDTQVFRPRPEMRDDVRDTLGIPRDAFLVGMVAANKSAAPSRKGFDHAFQAFAEFSKDHPDAWLYVHAQRQGLGHGTMGEDLELMMTATDLLHGTQAAKQVIFPENKIWDMGMPKASIAALYQAMDTLLHPAKGEGFGIPLVEAQACGVPVIASPHSAMIELCQAGWLVDGQMEWDKGAASYFWTPFNFSVKACLDAAYEARHDAELRDAAVEFARAYDADRVTVEFWEPALEALGASVGASRQVRRAQARAKAKQAA